MIELACLVIISTTQYVYIMQIMLCKEVLSFCAILLFISLNECLGVLHIISLYDALSLHNPTHLQVQFSLHCGIIEGAAH